MRHFSFFLKIIFRLKIIIKNPENYDLVIFDDSSTKDLEPILKKRRYFILENRIERVEKIYISRKIIELCIKNYNGKIWDAYILSLLDIINPKVVFTYIDNSLKFSEIAKLRNNKIQFIALQNGARYEHKENDRLYKKKIINYNNNKKFFIPHFLCFGDHEIKDYRKYNIKVNNFYPVGSLKVSNFLKYKKKNSRIYSNDICLISDVYAWDKIFDCYNSRLEKGIINLIKFVIYFSKKYKLKLMFALRSYNTDFKNFNREINFYKKYLTKEEYYFLSRGFFYRKKKNIFTSYELMRNSEVVVGSISTTLRENLAMNGKTLACNLTPTKVFDFPVVGLCFIKNCNYKSFEKRLIKIINISKKEYFSQINRNYIISCDSNISTIEKINNIIDSFLEV